MKPILGIASHIEPQSFGITRIPQVLFVPSDDAGLIEAAKAEPIKNVLVAGSGLHSTTVAKLTEIQIPITNPYKELHEDLENKRRRDAERFIHIDSPKPAAQGSLKLGSYRFKSSRRK